MNIMYATYNIQNLSAYISSLKMAMRFHIAICVVTPLELLENNFWALRNTVGVMLWYNLDSGGERMLRTYYIFTYGFTAIEENIIGKMLPDKKSVFTVAIRKQ